MVKVLLSVTIMVGLSPVLALVFSRMKNDWARERRFILVLGHLDWLDFPRGDLVLSEVRLAAPCEPSMCDEIVLVRCGSLGEQPITFHVDVPPGQPAQFCARWCDAATPLLLATDDRGAVLKGPGGQLLGQLVEPGIRRTSASSR